MTLAEKIEQVIDWILQRNSDHAVRASIAEEWPEDSADELIKSALEKIQAAGGMQSETLRHIFNQMMKIGDYPGAMRVLKEIEEKRAEAGLIVPVDATSDSGDSGSALLDDLDLTATPEEIQDYVPPKKRLPNVGQTSREELEFRYDQVAQWISSGKRKSQVKKLAYEAWGIAPRTFENYYTAAFEILREAADITPDEEYIKSCQFYDTVIADDSLEARDRLAARKAKDELTGIQRPRKTAVVGKNGQVVDPVTGGDVLNLSVVVNKLITSGMSDEQLQKLAEAGKVYEAIAKGKLTSEESSDGSVENGTGNTPA